MLFNLFRRAQAEEATPSTLETLQELAKRRDRCQRIHNSPTRFWVSFGAGNVRLNDIILLDIM